MKNNAIALVTGAAGIIGTEICAALSDAGWRVAATDLSEEEFNLSEIYQGAVRADGLFYADLSDLSACAKLVHEVEATLGPISLLVNNAALGQYFGGIGNVRPEDYQRLVNINLLAPFFLTQAALPSLREHLGSVVMISSVLSQMPKDGATLYGVTKAALEKQTEFLAHDLCKHGVRVNAIRVGSVPGGHFLRERMKGMEPERARALYEDVMKIHAADIAQEGEVPLLGKPADVANAILFLASEQARLVNGCTFPVDGALVIREPVMERLNQRKKSIDDIVDSYTKAYETSVSTKD